MIPEEVPPHTRLAAAVRTPCHTQGVVPFACAEGTRLCGSRQLAPHAMATLVLWETVNIGAHRGTVHRYR